MDAEMPKGGRRARHAAAIERLLARSTIEISPAQLLVLLTHLQANVVFQRRVTTTLAAIAAGEAEWGAMDEIAETVAFSEKTLDSFIFDLAEDGATHE